jgi:hypothetical protein
VAEARALREALAPYATLDALHGASDWPGLSARISALLDGVRVHTPPAPRPAAGDPRRVRVAHWNLEHGNRFVEIAHALERQPALAEADLVTLNEVDLGMARSGNRDVAAELGSRLGLHSAWTAMFLESTRGRDDDALTAVEADNAESLFDELRAAGFAWEPYNDGLPTLNVRFSRLGEVHGLPGPLRALASRGLRWAERRARLRLDWIAARGFTASGRHGRTIPGLDGPGLASDHAPIVAELAFE